MNTPFELCFRVEEVNYSPGQLSGLEVYCINVTLRHTIGDIKDSIWVNSEDFILSPRSLNLFYKDRLLTDSETIASVLSVPEVPLSPFNEKDLLLRIDYNHLVHIRPSTPVSLFDIVLRWRDLHEGEHKYTLRESLKCTIGSIKDFVVEQEQRKGIHQNITRINIQLRNMPDRQLMNNDNLTLGEMLKLDVTPLDPVVFLFDIRTRTRSTFQIIIESDEPTLQNERRIFDIDHSLRIIELKQFIVARIDLGGVSRTHFDQLELLYNGMKLPNTKETDQKTVIEAFDLNESTLDERDPVSIHLTISDNLSKANVLSGSFWRELSQTGSFEFLPGSLQRMVDGNIEGSSSSKHKSTLSEQPMSHPVDPIEPTKLITKDQSVWELEGESFEVISSPNIGKRLVNQSSISNTEFEVTLKVDDTIKSVTLNTSQCFIVDNDLHQPYLLVNPSGIAKLESEFTSSSGQSLLEKVEIMMFPAAQGSSARPILTARTSASGIEREVEQPANEQPVNEVDRGLNAVDNGVLNRTFNEGKRLLLLALKVVVVLYFMGVRPNKHIKTHWKIYLLVILVIFQLYILAFTGRNVFLAQQQGQARNINAPVVANAFNGLRYVDTGANYIRRAFTGARTKIIRVAVRRTWDHEIIVTEKSQLVKHLMYNVEILWKDSLLGVLSLLPSFQLSIHEELENWRNDELKAFESKTRLLFVLIEDLVKKYNDVLSPSFEIPRSMHFSEVESILAELESIDSEASLLETNEKKFKILIEYCKCLEVVSDVLNRGIESRQIAPESFIPDLVNTWTLLTANITRRDSQNENINRLDNETIGDQVNEEGAIDNVQLQPAFVQDEIPGESTHSEESSEQQGVDEDIIEEQNQSTASGSRILHEQGDNL